MPACWHDNPVINVMDMTSSMTLVSYASVMAGMPRTTTLSGTCGLTAMGPYDPQWHLRQMGQKFPTPEELSPLAASAILSFEIRMAPMASTASGVSRRYAGAPLDSFSPLRSVPDFSFEADRTQ